MTMESKSLILVKLENNGNCLFCQEPPEPSHQLKQYSLQTLLQYLKMKQIKVEIHIEPGEAPSHSLVDLEGSEVTAGLCGGCGSRVKRFLKLKKMMDSCLESMQTKMEVGIEKDDAGMKYPSREGMVMKEAVQKCKEMIGTRTTTNAGDVTGQQQHAKKNLKQRKEKIGLKKKSKSPSGAALDELQVPEVPLPGPSSAKTNEPLKVANSEEKNQEEKSPFECFYCEKGFPDKSKLEKHLAIDTKKPSHGCEFCGKRFASCRILLTHAKTHPEVAKKLYKCTKCAKTFTHKRNLSRHLTITHSNAQPFNCSLCGQKFKAKSDLKTHVQHVHDKVKKHECIFCNLAFFTSTKLNEHLRSHTNERPYFCSKCDEGFTRADTLKRHMKTKH